MNANLNQIWLPLALIAVATIGGAQAEDARVATAAAAFTSVANDNNKLTAFCGMLKDAEAINQNAQDETKTKALAAKIETAVKLLGQEFFNAWQLRPELNPTSIDAVPYFVAMNTLVTKCGS